jgi:hypothetical protein
LTNPFLGRSDERPFAHQKPTSQDGIARRNTIDCRTPIFYAFYTFSTNFQASENSTKMENEIG